MKNTITFLVLSISIMSLMAYTSSDDCIDHYDEEVCMEDSMLEELAYYEELNNPNPTIILTSNGDIVNNNQICLGEDFQLRTVEDYDYWSWSGPAIAGTNAGGSWYVTGNNDMSYEGMYTLTVTDSLGCVGTSSISITIAQGAGCGPSGYRPFITTWKTDNPGKTCISCIEIPTNPDYIYEYDIDWENDGIWDEFGLSGDATHDYGTAGTFDVAIRGNFPQLFFWENSNMFVKDNSKIVNVRQWGDIEWKNLSYSFSEAINLIEINASDIPNLLRVDSLVGTFTRCNNFQGSLKLWDVSNVKNMSKLFDGAFNYDENINSWDVGKVINMSNVFSGSKFNSPISSWNVSNVTNMLGIFNASSEFNQNIGSWNVSNVTDMEAMFSFASKFNKSLENWNVGNVTNMFGMFFNARKFNQNILSWQVGNVISMRSMFNGANDFDQSLKDWDMKSILDTNNQNGLYNMFDNTNLSIENYEATILGWSQNPNTPQDLELGAATLQYCDETGRNALINNLGWTISGDSQSLDCNFDCPDLVLNIGDACDDNDDNTSNDQVQQDCNCQGEEDGFRPFITTWKTDNPGESCNTCVIIPTNTDGQGTDYVYNYDIDWENDGVWDEFGLTGDATHDYGTPGTYDIAIRGEFPHLYHINIDGDNDKLIDVRQWGDVAWESMAASFRRCHNLFIFSATDNPLLSVCSSFDLMFSSASSFNGNIGNWDISQVTSMIDMFSGAKSFNQDLGNWDVSKVINMANMFKDAENFNQNISTWDVSEVTNMSNMFNGAKSFNQNIDNWDVSQVTLINSMFRNADNFNQNIGSWDVSRVINMGGMFANAENFNQDIGNWDVSQVTDMYYMLSNAKSFNQDLGNWDVSQVNSMNSMFAGAEVFNQDISNWDVSQVTAMSSMFNGASAFNQDIGNWDVSQVLNMNLMFSGAESFNQDIGNWILKSLTDDPLDQFDGIMSMLNNSGLSIQNYEATLLGWSQNPDTPKDLELGAQALQYCDETGRNALINNLGWTISGDSQSPGCNFDCPDLALNIGDDCDDNDDNTSNDQVQQDCSCLGESISLCSDSLLAYADECSQIGSDQTLGTLEIDTSFMTIYPICIESCLENASAETIISDCASATSPTVWIKLNTDPLAAQLFTTVSSNGAWTPTWSIYASPSNSCQDLFLVTGGTIDSPKYCGIGDGIHQVGVQEFNGQSITDYYVAISGEGIFNDSSFELCAYNTITPFVCIGSETSCDQDENYILFVNDRDADGTLEGPFCPGETLEVCIDFFYDASETGVDWLIGIVPNFGSSWDISEFDPLDVQITPGGAAWYMEGSATAPLIQESVPHLCTFINEYGQLEVCNLLCEFCPCSGGMDPLDPLPSGWFWVQDGGLSGCDNDGSPGEGYGIGTTTAQIELCMNLKIKDYDSEIACLEENDLSIGIQTFSDGVAGCWDDPVGECLIDKKQIASVGTVACRPAPDLVTDPIIEMTSPYVICSDNSVDLEIRAQDGSNAEVFIVAIDNPNVSGEKLEGYTFEGVGIVNEVLVNNTSSPQTVIYSSYSRSVDGPCYSEVFNFEVIVNPPLIVQASTQTYCRVSEEITSSNPILKAYTQNGFDNNINYNWEPISGAPLGGSISENGNDYEIPWPILPGIYNYRVIVSDDSSSVACTDEAIITLEVLPELEMYFDENTYAFCINDSIDSWVIEPIIVSSTSLESILYEVSPIGLDFVQSDNKIAVSILTSIPEVSYTVNVIAVDSNSCTKETEFKILILSEENENCIVEPCEITANDDFVSTRVNEEFSINILDNDTYPINVTWEVTDVSEDIFDNLFLDESGQLSGSVNTAFGDTIHITYELCDAECNICENAEVHILNSALEDLVLTDIISPNNDGQNDILRFNRAESISGSRLIIFNRWGDRIFEAAPYENDWTASGYPGGIYFYVLEVDGAIVKKTLTVVK